MRRQDRSVTTDPADSGRRPAALGSLVAALVASVVGALLALGSALAVAPAFGASAVPAPDPTATTAPATTAPPTTPPPTTAPPTTTPATTLPATTVPGTDVPTTVYTPPATNWQPPSTYQSTPGTGSAPLTTTQNLLVGPPPSTTSTTTPSRNAVAAVTKSRSRGQSDRRVWAVVAALVAVALGLAVVTFRYWRVTRPALVLAGAPSSPDAPDDDTPDGGRRWRGRRRSRYSDLVITVPEST